MLATYQGASQRRGLWRPLHLEAQPGQVQGRFSINFDHTLRLLIIQTFTWKPNLAKSKGFN